MRSPPNNSTIGVLTLGEAGEFELDRSNRELRRGSDVVDLEPRPFRLLEYLVEERGRLVSKDELLEQVWEGAAVSDTALSTALKHVRRALGDRATNSHWIQSRRGRGYRFIAAAREAENSSAMASDPIFGRDEIVGELRRSVEAARNGSGSATLLAGTPGIGKTRLAEEALRFAAGLGFHVWRGWAVAGRESAEPLLWNPILRDMRAPLGEAGSFLREIETVSRDRPVAILLEDLDQADATSLRLLDQLLPELPSSAILIIGTLRSDVLETSNPLLPTLAQIARHAWSDLVRLDGLVIEDVAEMIIHLNRGSSTQYTAEELHHRTAGNPFQLRAVLLDTRAHDAKDPPVAVRDEVRGRMSSLEVGRSEIISAASAVGDVCDAELVAVVSKSTLEATRDALAAADRLLLGRLGSDGRFRFGSPLVREAIYAGLDPLARVELHERISSAVEDTTSSGETNQWMRDLEESGNGFQEASLRHLERGFEALGDLMPGTTRDQFEMELQMTFARALSRTQGWAGETIEAWQRASELCARHGEVRREGIVRFGLAAGFLTLGRIEDALYRYNEVFKLGEDSDDRILQIAGCIRGVPLLYLGRLRESAASLRNGIDLSIESDDFMGMGFSEDFLTTLPQWLGWTLWLLGDRRGAKASLSHSLSLARDRDPFMLAYSLTWNAVLAVLDEDFDAAEQLGEEAETLALRERYPLIESLSRMVRATARGLAGDTNAAAAASDDFVTALTSMSGSGNRSGAPLMMACLAKVQVRARRLEAAEDTIRLGLALSADTGPFFVPELIRMRGEVARAKGDGHAAALDYQSAVEHATQMEAVSFAKLAQSSLDRVREEAT